MKVERWETFQRADSDGSSVSSKSSSSRSSCSSRSIAFSMSSCSSTLSSPIFSLNSETPACVASTVDTKLYTSIEDNFCGAIEDVGFSDVEALQLRELFVPANTMENMDVHAETLACGVGGPPICWSSHETRAIREFAKTAQLSPRVENIRQEESKVRLPPHGFISPSENVCSPKLPKNSPKLPKKRPRSRGPIVRLRGKRQGLLRALLGPESSACPIQHGLPGPSPSTDALRLPFYDLPSTDQKVAGVAASEIAEIDMDDDALSTASPYKRSQFQEPPYPLYNYSFPAGNSSFPTEYFEPYQPNIHYSSDQLPYLRYHAREQPQLQREPSEYDSLQAFSFSNPIDLIDPETTLPQPQPDRSAFTHLREFQFPNYLDHTDLQVPPPPPLNPGSSRSVDYIGTGEVWPFPMKTEFTGHTQLMSEMPYFSPGEMADASPSPVLVPLAERSTRSPSSSLRMVSRTPPPSRISTSPFLSPAPLTPIQDQLPHYLPPSASNRTRILSSTVDTPIVEQPKARLRPNAIPSNLSGLKGKNNIESPCSSVDTEYDDAESPSSGEDTEIEDDETNCSPYSDTYSPLGDGVLECGLEGKQAFIRPILTPMKQSLVDRVMEEFWIIFKQEWAADVRQNNSGASTSSSTNSRVVTPPDSETTPEKIRKHPKDKDDEETPEENDDRRPPKRPRRPVAAPDGKEVGPKFACPFRKHDPLKYDLYNHRSCALSCWDSISRIKEHLYRRHRMPIHCKRCHDHFKSQDALDSHITVAKADICELRPGESVEGITAQVERQLRSRKKSSPNQSEEERWKEVYRLLFPDEIVPEPYFEPVQDDPIASPDSQNLARFEEYSRRELPRLVRHSLENIVNQEAQPLEENLKRSLVSIIQDCQERLFSAYGGNSRSIGTPAGSSNTPPSSQSQKEKGKGVNRCSISQSEQAADLLASVYRRPPMQSTTESLLTQEIHHSAMSIDRPDVSVHSDSGYDTGRCTCSYSGPCNCSSHSSNQDPPEVADLPVGSASGTMGEAHDNIHDRDDNQSPTLDMLNSKLTALGSPDQVFEWDPFPGDTSGLGQIESFRDGIDYFRDGFDFNTSGFNEENHLP